jgi:hypothetical protein
VQLWPYEDHMDEYQIDRDERLSFDDDPVPITRCQAEKCAAVVDAYVGGLDLYWDAVRAVERFLRAAVVAALAEIRPSAVEEWAVINAVPGRRRAGCGRTQTPTRPDLHNPSRPH